MRLFRHEQAERAFETQRAALRSNDSPEAAELRSFQEEHGIDRPLPPHPLDQARVELEAIDKEIARLDARIAGLHQAAARHGTYVGYQGRIDAAEARKEHLEALASKLWGAVHPPLIAGDRAREPLPKCKTPGCGVILDPSELFERSGWCVDCFEVATGRAAPPQPDPDTARIDALLARL